MSIFSQALKVHANALTRAAGEWITYRRGQHDFPLRAVPGESLVENQTGYDDTRVLVKQVDFLVLEAELRNPWGCVETMVPELGDQIIRENGDVMDVVPGASEAVWEWSDSNHTFRRIHTVKR